jgi:T-complex protein 1 subunit zeta
LAAFTWQQPGCAADIKLTKDGNALLREMQITNPTALMIARTAVAQDDVTGDGTTSTVVLIGELLRHSERHLQEGLHPRLIVEGLDAAKDATLAFLDKFSKNVDPEDTKVLKSVAHTALATKLPAHLADLMTDAVVNAVLCIKQPDEPLDLHMIEIMHMRHKLDQVPSLVQSAPVRSNPPRCHLYLCTVCHSKRCIVLLLVCFRIQG